MKKFIKNYLKRKLPKFALRLRVQKILQERLDPDLYVLASLKKYLSESRHTRKILDYFSEESVAIDVGACRGEYSYVLASNFKNVLSIEPIPEMAMLLRQALPSNCETIECAVGDSVREVCLRIPRIGDQSLGALATIADHSFDFSNIDTVDNLIINQCTLDVLIAKQAMKPSFIKVDVEGYEMNVLRGSMKVIEAYKPIFMIEIEKRHNKNFQEIFSLLDLQGYVPYHFRHGNLDISNPKIVDESYEYLQSNGIQGMYEIINIRASENYINNFFFIPIKN
jgi:FkbM family methyltransferase